MDPVTHALSSLALQRAVWPGASRWTIVAMIGAGTVSDLDWFAASFGPGSYLHWHRSATHSLPFVGLLALGAFLFERVAREGRTASSAPKSWCGAVALAAALHIALDSLQAATIAPFWPFASNRLSLDVVPSLDLSILSILIAAILLPELFRLVGSEIGARDKRPRGRNGAIASFLLLALYVGLRAQFHSAALAWLDAHTIAGESPRRVAAFPDAASPFLWHAIVETQSTLNLVTLRTSGNEPSYASPVTTIHKPEWSPLLGAAQSSAAAIEFLKHARFPKATVQKETDGFSVEIQDLQDQANEGRSRGVMADINLDKAGAVTSSEIQWQKTPVRR